LPDFYSGCAIGISGRLTEGLLLWRSHLKEGPARGNDTQVVVEHQKRIANRIDDGVRQRSRIRNGCVWDMFRHYRNRHSGLSASISSEANTARIFIK
jgi:hypothetical protein